MLNFPLVQTWLTHRVAAYYSAKLHAKVQIGKVDFEFLKKLVLRDIYVQDLHQDTLLYTKELKIDIGALDFEKHTLYASDIIFDKTRLHFATYKGIHELNLQFIIDALASKDTTPSNPNTPRWDFRVGNLAINNCFLEIENQNDTSTYHGIKFSDMRIHDIYLKASDIKFEGDTLRATMDKLTAREESGFMLNNFSCYVKLSSKKMELDALNIQTPNTVLSTDLVFKYNHFPDFLDFINKVDMHAVFHHSKLCFDDVSYFADALKGVHNCFTLSGEYSGTVTKLKGQNIDIGWGKDSRIQGDALLTGLPDITKTHIQVRVNDLITSKSDIEMLPRPPFDREDHIRLPNNIGCLGVAELTGYFDGYVTDFKTSGTLTSDIGDISANLAMRQDTLHNDMAYYKGSVSTIAFDFGTFWNNKDLGPVTASVSIEGKGLTRDNADAKLTGAFQDISFKKYNYTNLDMNGELRKGFFSGVLNAKDPNLVMNFNGNIDIASSVHSYKFNADIAKADLVKLKLIHDSTGREVLSTYLDVSLKGNDIDAMDGTVNIDSTKFAYHKNNYHLNHFSLNSAHKGDIHIINATSDYADIKLSGYFPLTHADRCIQNLMHAYIPSVFQEEVHDDSKTMPGKTAKKEKSLYHDYDLEVHFNENTGLTDLFIPSLCIAKGSDIKAMYKEATSSVTVSGKSSLIEWGGRKFRNWNLDASGNASKLSIKSNVDSLFISDSLYAAAFTANGNIDKDTAHYTLKWSNDSANYGEIPGYVAFPTKTEVVFKLQNPLISLSDSAWQVNNKNTVTMDTDGIVARDLEFYHNVQSIFIQGKLSKQKNDAMLITFRKLNLKDFNIGNTTDLQGVIEGTVSIANIYNRHPFFAGSLNFNNLSLNKQSLGNGSLNSYWDNESQSLALNGQFVDHDSTLFSFLGNYYDRDTDNLSLDATMHKFPLKIFQPYIKDYCSEIDGNVAGNVHVFGNLNKPLVRGNITAGLKRLKFDYLNTYYHSPAINIAIAPDTFQLLPSPLLDDRQDTAMVSGNLTHNQFKDFNLDFTMDARNFLCLNTTESLNSLYYGKGYASGNVSIYGPLSNIHIDANITTEKGTVFNIPLSNASEVGQADFIRFVDKKGALSKKSQKAYKVETGGLQMDFTVHITPDATSQLIFAQKLGDILTGRGTGTIQLDMNTEGNFSIKGNYTVKDGTYLFTLRNTLSKNFNIREGGTINWSGDPYNADINLTAVYSKRTTLSPLASLFPNDSTVAKKSYPYYCDMNLKGKLQSPQISFNIELPTVDGSTRQTLDSYLASSPDEMDRQVFSLLILNSFLPPQDRPSVSTSAASGIAAGLNSTEFLSDELNNMLSSISNKFNVGFVYQPGTAVTGQELQVLFSTQLFNERVSVTSDFGTVGMPVTGPVENANNIVGEVNIEYKVSKDGRVKLKAFNRANDNSTITLSNAPYTQGGGISYRKSFNTLGDLFGKQKNKAKKDAKKEQNSSSTM